jgi:hypothetical protein
MKFFKILGIVLIVLVFLFIVVGLFLPKTATLERRVTIDASAQALSDEILGLYEAHLWPFWDHKDTSIVFTPLPSGKGYRWEGDKVAYGECEYNISANNEIRDNIRFRGRDLARTSWTLEGSAPVRLHLVFTVNSNGNLGTRWTNLFLESLSGPQIVAILQELKETLEYEGLREASP